MTALSPLPPAADASAALIDVRPDARTRRLRRVAAILALAAVALGPVAMARPAIDRTAKEKRPTLVVAIDESKSMLKTDVQPNRLEAAKDAVRRLLAVAPDEAQIGLIAFSDGARALVAPTRDREAVRRALDAMQVREGTAIGDAVVAGISQLQNANALASPASTDPPPGRILLVTDGAQSAGTVQPDQAAERARAARVPVSSVLLGSDPGRPGQDPPDVTLARLSRTTDGVFTRSTSSADLSRLFEDLGSTLSTVRRTDEVTVWVGLLMLLLLGGAGMALAAQRPGGLARPAPHAGA